MYQIFCDGYPIYDPRDEDYIVNAPKCKLKVNTVGEASFSVFATHPYYGIMQKLKSVFEIRQDGEPIFRGRMTDDTKDFNNILMVDLEGALAYFNDSQVRPYKFPEDFVNSSGYLAAANSGNVVEFFLKWLIDNHNSRVQPFQRFKLGKVTVKDPNNYITRSDSDYKSTWEILKTKLFESALGGYLCIRYEPDGNYIDYLKDFELTNQQHIVYGENLLDIVSESDATATYSAMIPQGKKLKEIDSKLESDSRLSVSGLPDGNITNDLVKSDDAIYSKSAVDRFGWICAPVSETTWEDITLVGNLKTRAVEAFTDIVKFLNTLTIKAVDLHFSDKEIESFRMYRYTVVESSPHNHQGQYILSELDIDLLNPQNTMFTLGNTTLSLTDVNKQSNKNQSEKIDIILSQTEKEATDLSDVQSGLSNVQTGLSDVKSELSEVQKDVENLSSDTGWVDLTLREGITVGSEIGYLKGKLKNGILYIKGDVTGIAANETYIADIPSELLPAGLSENTRFVGVYNTAYLCILNLKNTGELYVTANSTDAWDSTLNVTLNTTICV